MEKHLGAGSVHCVRSVAGSAYREKRDLVRKGLSSELENAKCGKEHRRIANPWISHTFESLKRTGPQRIRLAQFESDVIMLYTIPKVPPREHAAYNIL